MPLNLKQIETRLRSTRWQLPGKRISNLWGSEGKNLISTTMLRQLVNQALIEWATENKIDRKTWTLDDGSGGEGTLTIDQRKYALPNDALVITEAKVAYNDTSNFLGYPLILVNERFLDSTLTNIEAFRIAGAAVDEFNYQSYAIAAGTIFPLTVTYASLGPDVHGNEPSATFNNPPFHEAPMADADVDVFVTSNDETSFTLDVGAFSSVDPPYNINFTFRVVSGSLLQQIQPEKNLPQRMFIWQDEFWLDPVPDQPYTFRMFGYHLPSTLTSDTDTPDPLGIYHEAIYLKAKEFVARELNVTNENQILSQYQRVAIQAKQLDKERHHSPMFVDVMRGNVYYDD